jgi:hypothetical protein
MIAESFMAHGSKAMSGGDRHQIVLHIDAETLQHKVAGCCELEDGPSIAAETASRSWTTGRYGSSGLMAGASIVLHRTIRSR